MEVYTPDEMNIAIARVETAKQNHPVGWGYLKELNLPGDDLVFYSLEMAETHLPKLERVHDLRVVYSVGWLNGVGIGVSLGEQRIQQQ